jgi:hypothetical protein
VEAQTSDTLSQNLVQLLLLVVVSMLYKSERKKDGFFLSLNKPNKKNVCLATRHGIDMMRTVRAKILESQNIVRDIEHVHWTIGAIVHKVNSQTA